MFAYSHCQQLLTLMIYVLVNAEKRKEDVGKQIVLLYRGKGLINFSTYFLPCDTMHQPTCTNANLLFYLLKGVQSILPLYDNLLRLNKSQCSTNKL